MLDFGFALKAYSRLRAKQLARSPRMVQQNTLLSLLNEARETRFGVEHGFRTIRSTKAFQAQVPLRDYEQFWRDYWQTGFPHHVNLCWPGPMPYFALSSGTTSGVTKYIPCSEAMCRSNSRTAWDVLVHHVNARPRSKVLGGVSLMLGGSTELETLARGVLAGDLSGIASSKVPRWLRGRVYPPLEVAHMRDWEAKITLLAEALPAIDIRSMSGTPSWLLVLLEKISSNQGRSIAELFPNLELVIHGGTNFTPYRSRFANALAGSSAELREVYAASEGFFAIADHGPDEGMQLELDRGIFYEFVPVDTITSNFTDDSPQRLTIEEVSLDTEYAIVVSTCAGLWSYVVGDTVRFVSLNPPKILVTGRISYTLSAFGEHVIEAELQQAVHSAATELGLTVIEFCVSTQFLEHEHGRDQANNLGVHHYVIEAHFDNPDSPSSGHLAPAMSTRIDKVLTEINADYLAHRVPGSGLSKPVVTLARAGSFLSWMRVRGKLGGQNKVPRVINDPKLFDSLLAHIESQA